ncbi:hypothetical protein C0J52_00718 [Blattella germanica]|nr:hypothetical protein C0J52_00718 [Blattella germanica]
MALDVKTTTHRNKEKQLSAKTHGPESFPVCVTRRKSGRRLQMRNLLRKGRGKLRSVSKTTPSNSK